ncbi:hypothetical protein F4859DRAFT_82018 [Xylaria cf. heliscus]|nr:hypothetical protein F4859DRAFT_82018 [Xylaria cf. heliscus]
MEQLRSEMERRIQYNASRGFVAFQYSCSRDFACSYSKLDGSAGKKIHAYYRTRTSGRQRIFSVCTPRIVQEKKGKSFSARMGAKQAAFIAHPIGRKLAGFATAHQTRCCILRQENLDERRADRSDTRVHGCIALPHTIFRLRFLYLPSGQSTYAYEEPKIMPFERLNDLDPLYHGAKAASSTFLFCTHNRYRTEHLSFFQGSAGLAQFNHLRSSVQEYVGIWGDTRKFIAGNQNVFPCRIPDSSRRHRYCRCKNSRPLGNLLKMTYFDDGYHDNYKGRCCHSPYR